MGKRTRKDRESGITDFMRIITHEMNNALCGASNEAQLLLLSEGLTEEQRKGLHTILHNIQRSAARVHDIYSTTMAICRDEVIIKSKDFCLYDAIDDALISLQSSPETDDGTVSIAREGSGRITKPIYYRGKKYLRGGDYEPVVVKGDRKFTGFVFSNLFTNACIHGKSRIDFDVDQEDSLVRCMIANDTENGIPEQYRERLFQPYFRIPGTKVYGSGLGLYASKRLVELQGGRIWFENPNGEVRFYFTLPVAGSSGNL